MMKTIVLISATFMFVLSSNAQVTDSSISRSSSQFHFSHSSYTNPVAFKAGIVPFILTGYGLFAMTNPETVELDKSIREEIWSDHLHKPVTLDNYLQYSPALAVFGLNAAGIKGKNDLKDEAILYLLSNAVMASIVNPLKYATHLKRPDGFGRNAFPSGHTATAFVAAEFLNQEYTDRSPWYGIAGYATAAGVGFMRMYNNRHWMRDVAAGAGIGMLSTKFSYWLYPKIEKSLFEKKELRQERVREMSQLAY